MKKYRGIALLVIAVIVNVIETIYFGCNDTALTAAEMVWDGICAAMMWIGIFWMSYDWADYLVSGLAETAKSRTELRNAEQSHSVTLY